MRRALCTCMVGFYAATFAVASIVWHYVEGDYVEATPMQREEDV